jgi:hypothetical protein
VKTCFLSLLPALVRANSQQQKGANLTRRRRSTRCKLPPVTPEHHGRPAPSPEVTNWRPTWGQLRQGVERALQEAPCLGALMITRFRSRQLVGVVEEAAMDDAQPTQTNTESSQNSQVTPQSVVVMSHDETLRPVLPTGGSATPASSITAPTAVLRSEEYLPTFSGDPDEDPEDFITAPANAILPERVKAKIAHRQLRGQAARVNKFFATRDRCLSDLETRLREEFGVEANFTSLYQQFQRGNLGWEEPVEVFFARQAALYQRLFPEAPEARLVKELIGQFPLRPDPFWPAKASGVWRTSDALPNRSSRI